MVTVADRIGIWRSNCLIFMPVIPSRILSVSHAQAVRIQRTSSAYAMHIALTGEPEMDLATGWTGRSAVALQAALRLSNQRFADKLGIGERTVWGWHDK